MKKTKAILAATMGLMMLSSASFANDNTGDRWEGTAGARQSSVHPLHRAQIYQQSYLSRTKRFIPQTTVNNTTNVYGDTHHTYEGDVSHQTIIGNSSSVDSSVSVGDGSSANVDLGVNQDNNGSLSGTQKRGKIAPKARNRSVLSYGKKK